MSHYDLGSGPTVTLLVGSEGIPAREAVQLLAQLEAHSVGKELTLHVREEGFLELVAEGALRVYNRLGIIMRLKGQ